MNHFMQYSQTSAPGITSSYSITEMHADVAEACVTSIRGSILNSIPSSHLSPENGSFMASAVVTLAYSPLGSSTSFQQICPSPPGSECEVSPSTMLRQGLHVSRSVCQSLAVHRHCMWEGQQAWSMAWGIQRCTVGQGPWEPTLCLSLELTKACLIQGCCGTADWRHASEPVGHIFLCFTALRKVKRFLVLLQ